MYIYVDQPEMLYFTLGKKSAFGKLLHVTQVHTADDTGLETKESAWKKTSKEEKKDRRVQRNS